ncbi:diguanylate cyclase (GGDEF) domain-containing protein [Desulfurobacterium pacificum]|uniref:diguanylate cyclase n=1 Tax=Desulfurobacterium pacificum TaxID=240166 RepID=A0ABY1N6U0_9BACT|nr:GGDEF domain-containing protein [Desulfurobacterium pacificum]SMP01982.1 diguanylate cyclase (GGDEF) domain-containing protein [Desulfurobacterium pacificum]
MERIKIKKLAEEIGVSPERLLMLAQEDYDYGCRRNGNVVAKDLSRKPILMFQSNQFLKAFKRRIFISRDENFPKDYLVILNRIEDFIAGRYSKRYLPLDNSKQLEVIFDAFNDLADSINFFMSVVAPERIKYLAFKDPLTDAYNRHFLLEHIRFLSNYNDYFPVGVIFIDMDDLKKINDMLGHKVGDIYLTKVVEAIRNSTRNSDKVFRIGGDEFVVLVPRADREILERIMDRIYRQIDYINRVEEFNPPLSVSMGYSIWSSPEIPFTKALEKADLSMYRRKKEE